MNRTTAKLERVAFRTSRLLDFCSEKELVAQTGHRKEDWPLVVVKELIDNGIDACEEAGIPPKIMLRIGPEGIAVADNGPGIPAETVQAVLDFSVRVSSREAYVSPTRGAQGNALKTILAMPYVLGGERGRVDVAARSVRHEITFRADPIRQEPVIDRQQQPDRLVKTGTAVRVHWPESARSLLADARARILQIADDYTFLNPHLTLTVDWHGELTKVAASNPVWRKWLPSYPTSPHWYTPEQFERLLAAHLAHGEDRGRERTVRELVAEFKGLTGTAKQKAVLDATGLARAGLASLRNSEGLDHKKAGRLLAAMQGQTRPVRAADLGVIGKDHLASRCEQLGVEMESFQYRKAMGETDGLPWVMETAFAWCPPARSRRLVTGVNWSPAVGNPFRQLGKAGLSLDAVLEQQRAGRREPVVLVLHMACPRVSYTDRGKTAVVIGGGSGDEEE